MDLRPTCDPGLHVMAEGVVADLFGIIVIMRQENDNRRSDGPVRAAPGRLPAQDVMCIRDAVAYLG